jgi:hypothetical protein
MDTLIDNIKVCDGVARMTGNEQAHDVLAKARRSCPSSVDGPLPKWAKSVFGSKSRRVGIAHHRVHSKPYEPYVLNGHLDILMVGDAHPICCYKCVGYIRIALAIPCPAIGIVLRPFLVA